LKLQAGAIWHSGKKRAEQTAEILGSAVTAGEGVVQREGLSPKDEVGPVRREIEQGGQDVMIVGHLPFLSRLVACLAADGDSVEVVAFRQGGVVCMERDEEQRWSVRWMIVPEILRRETTDS
jgi:phosphohistidine phosphatase